MQRLVIASVVALMLVVGGYGWAVDQVLVSDGFDGYLIANFTTSPAGGFAGGLGWASGQGWFVTDAANGGGGIVNKDIAAAGLTGAGKHLGTTAKGDVGRVMASRSPGAGQPLWVGFWFIAQGVQSAYQANSADTGNFIAFRKTDFSSPSNEVISLNTGGTPFTDGSGTHLRWRLGTVDLADPNIAKVDDNPHYAVLKIETTQVSVWLYSSVPGTAPDSSAGMAVATVSSPQIDRLMLATAGDSGILRFDGFMLGTSWTAISDPTMPTIASVSPTSGRDVVNLQPTTVTVTGTNFTGAAVVAFDGVAATTSFVSATTLTATLPEPHAAGAVDVTVTIGSKVALLQGGFTYVAPTTADPALVALPSISGSPTLGSTLTADPGTWNPVPSGFAYQWERADDAGGTNLAAIAGATASTYVVVDADVDHVVRVTVTPAGSSPPKSASSAYVACSDPLRPTIATVTSSSGPTVITAPPTTVALTGTNFASGAVVTFGGAASPAVTVSSATALTAALPAHAAGTVDVQVTVGAKTGTKPAAFTFVAPTTAQPAVTRLPAVLGTPTPGATVTSDPGDWTPTPSGFTYQWLRADDAVGTNLSPIVGATASTYLVATADLGAYLGFTVVANGSSPAASASATLVQVIVPKAGARSLSEGAAGSSRCGLGAAAAALLLMFAGWFRRQR